MSIDNFDVLKTMGERSMDIRLAPLTNIVNLRKVRAGTQVTIVVEGDVVAALGLDNKFVGGLVLASKDQFNAVKSELLKGPMAKSRAEIEAEIAALELVAKDYDTKKQSNDTCVGTGAHDALRWALGLAEDSISETLKQR